MLASMTAEQFIEWAEFHALEPWGTEIDDHRAGVLAAAVTNSAGKTLQPGAEPRRASDFFPNRLPKPPESLADKLKRLLGAPTQGASR